MLMRYDKDKKAVRVIKLKRWTGSGWKPCLFMRRWTGSEWETVWTGVEVTVSLSPDSSIYHGGIDYSEDGTTSRLTVGYYVDDEHEYQTGYVKIKNIEPGQIISFSITQNYTSYARGYSISGLEGISPSNLYKNTSFRTFSAPATGNTVMIGCHTDFADTIFTVKNIMVDGQLILFNVGG